MNDIAHQAGLEIVANDNVLEIKHRFRWSDKANWGVLFFFCACVFLVVAPLIKGADTTSKIAGIVIGLLLCVASIMTVIRQVRDGLKMTETEIVFSYNLKRTNLTVSSYMKIKMRTEVIVSRVSTLGSEFILVTHFLQYTGKEIPILHFQMDNVHADKAVKLGNEIMQFINEKIPQGN